MRKKCLIVLLIVVLCISFAACGTSRDDKENDSNRSEESYYSQYTYSDEYVYTDESAQDVNLLASFTTERKLVYTANISIETLDFEKSQQMLNEALSSCGGYIYSSELYGGNRYSQQNSSVRSMYVTIKIPSDKYREFLSGKDNFGNVKFFSEQTDDITSQYIDTQSRLNALKEQEERLLALIEKAQSVKELLEIEETLSEVRYKKENYTSQMQTYENMIAFCTVNLTITEVSEVSKVNEGFFTKFSEAFRSSWIELLNFIQYIAIWITARLSFILLIAIMCFLIYRAVKKKKKAETNKMPNFPIANTSGGENTDAQN